MDYLYLIGGLFIGDNDILYYIVGVGLLIKSFSCGVGWWLSRVMGGLIIVSVLLYSSILVLCGIVVGVYLLDCFIGFVLLGLLGGCILGL